MPSNLAWAPVAMINASQVYVVPESPLSLEGPRLDIRFHDHVIDDLGADMLGLLQHLLHKPRALDRIRKAWIIFNIGGDCQLTALLQSRNQNRLEQCTRRIDRGSVASRAGTDDEHRRVFHSHVVTFDAGRTKGASLGDNTCLTTI